MCVHNKIRSTLSMVAFCMVRTGCKWSRLYVLMKCTVYSCTCTCIKEVYTYMCMCVYIHTFIHYCCDFEATLYCISTVDPGWHHFSRLRHQSRFARVLQLGSYTQSIVCIHVITILWCVPLVTYIYIWPQNKVAKTHVAYLL